MSDNNNKSKTIRPKWYKDLKTILTENDELLATPSSGQLDVSEPLTTWTQYSVEKFWNCVLCGAEEWTGVPDTQKKQFEWHIKCHLEALVKPHTTVVFIVNITEVFVCGGCGAECDSKSKFIVHTMSHCWQRVRVIRHFPLKPNTD